MRSDLFRRSSGDTGLDGLGLGQKPIVMPHYPHMLSNDVAVWTRFLESGVLKPEVVWYDFHVGDSVELPDGVPPMEVRIAQGLTRKRIDAVCLRTGNYWAVEVRPVCSMSAVGNAVFYARLLAQEVELDGGVFPVVVCDRVDHDVARFLDELGVMVLSNEYA